MSLPRPTRQTKPAPGSPVDPAGVLAALPYPVLVIEGGEAVCEANAAAEAFFRTSRRRLVTQPIVALLPEASPLAGLVADATLGQRTVTGHGLDLTTPAAGSHRSVDAVIAPFGEVDGGRVVVTLMERGAVEMLERQLSHRSAARALTGLAAVLAHEIKNPLSGIRGAAQLLEGDADEEGRALTGLICAETDRICRLVDRMQEFGAEGAGERHPVNVHEVLEHVRQLAAAGFASSTTFTELYDPSLPPVAGNRDRLVQAFLNLVKNAAEAVASQPEGRITLHTAYRPGLHRQALAGQRRESLPLIVAIEDNGPGVPASLAPHIFDPFVTGKPSGSGLGLALVAKIVEEHGGAVELEQRPGRTIFRIALPIGESAP
ncbi:MAG: ATP-binding protein [Hyphomicrobiaceae bacterium]